MNRRTFFHNLMIGAGILAMDPEQLLWTPKKTIFIPPVASYELEYVGIGLLDGHTETIMMNFEEALTHIGAGFNLNLYIGKDGRVCVEKI